MSPATTEVPRLSTDHRGGCSHCRGERHPDEVDERSNGRACTVVIDSAIGLLSPIMLGASSSSLIEPIPVRHPAHEYAGRA
jgi:hypothetical protein